MLNELLVVEHGMRRAGIEMKLRHPDLRDAGDRPTAFVWLEKSGHVSRVRPVPRTRRKEKPLWKISAGQKNSFPFVQPKALWHDETIRAWKERLGRKPTDAEKRRAILVIAPDAKMRDKKLGEWTGKAIAKALRARSNDLTDLRNTDASVLLETIDRFLKVIDSDNGEALRRLIRNIAAGLVGCLQSTNDSDTLNTAIAILTQSGEKGGALFFDAHGTFPLSLSEEAIQAPICEALRRVDLKRARRIGQCSLTGEPGVLVSDSFSQPNLQFLGQSFLFARNKDIPSMTRYDRKSSDTIPVGLMTDIRLRAALEALTSKEREGKTWRRIPGEAPKQWDLLLAFVAEAIDVEVADMLAGDDFAEEETEATSSIASSIAAFEKRTERLISAFQGKVQADFPTTPIQLAVIRKVDQANRKVVYSGAPTVGVLYDAAKNWSAGERNVPPGLRLPVFSKGESKPTSPPHVAPLGVIHFTKQIFLRSGKRPPGKKKEQAGVPAGEVLGLFLDSVEPVHGPARQRVQRVLRLTLRRRTGLLAGTSHALRRDFKVPKEFDRLEALRTVTVLGLLLHKLGRVKEVYMSDTAFKLGQLLTAADAVHAGYCADVRGGSLPPSLLGNQVFVMAQIAPTKALAVLCRRWKPYDGWAKKATREAQRIDAIIASKAGGDEQRGWDIRKALRHAREMGPLAAQLAPALESCDVDDTFRAELLLGYIAGLPKTEKEGVSDNAQPNQESEQED